MKLNDPGNSRVGAPKTSATVSVPLAEPARLGPVREAAGDLRT